MSVRKTQSGPTSTGLRRNVKKLVRTLRLKPFYQEERRAVFEERWAAIEARLSPGDSSFIDIGCNIGDFTASAASRGMFAIGIDAMEEAILFARKRHAKLPRCAFVLMDVTAAEVAKLPQVDVMLCLSVHHYWSRAVGEAGAWDMIGALAAKSRSFFFEPATSYERYGAEVPDFKEHDQDSLDRYVMGNFARVAPGHSVTHVNSTKSINKEDFRPMYLISKAAAVRGA